MQLSPHFSLAEFCRSDTADRLGIDNDLPATLLPAAKVTAAMLERIRDHLSAKAGKPVPIIISSGYRSPATNKAVGSGPTSDHLDAAAADWKAPAFGTPTEVCLGSARSSTSFRARTAAGFTRQPACLSKRSTGSSPSQSAA